MVQLLQCGFAHAMKAEASCIGRVFLDARQNVEDDLRARIMALGFQAHAHGAVKGTMKATTTD